MKNGQTIWLDECCVLATCGFSISFAMHRFKRHFICSKYGFLLSHTNNVKYRTFCSFSIVFFFCSCSSFNCKWQKIQILMNHEWLSPSMRQNCHRNFSIQRIDVVVHINAHYKKQTKKAHYTIFTHKCVGETEWGKDTHTKIKNDCTTPR